MQEVFEKIIEELEENQTIVFRNGKPTQSIDFVEAIEIVNRAADEYSNGWISVEERLPECHMAVWVSFTTPYHSFVKKAYWGHDCEIMTDVFKWENGKRMKDIPTAWKPYYTPEPYQPKE